MRIPSRRSAVQEFFERKSGCADFSDFFNYSTQLEAVKLNLGDEQELFEHLSEDVAGFYERHVLTLLQAFADLERGDRLWACVKLYYSVFYALRVELNLNSIAVVRTNKFYSCLCKRGEQAKKYNGRQSGDHGFVIDLCRRMLGDQDILQMASINETLPYFWLKSLRDTVQYKTRRPPELDGFDPFFPPSQMSFHDQIGIFLADSDPYYPFDPDYAALAIAVKRFQLTSRHVKANGIALDADFLAMIDQKMVPGTAGTLLRPYLQ